MAPETRSSRRRRASAPDATPQHRFEISPRVERQAQTRPYRRTPGSPQTRPLRIFTLDPSVSHRVGGIATVEVPYEPLEPGPVGALFAVDPAVAAPALDLEAPHLLMTHGLQPSPADGRFAAQMVYAVCSLTYAAFRRALGRDIAWACEDLEGRGRSRLTVRPFAFRQRNAGYSREAADLSFGYFRAGREPAGSSRWHGCRCRGTGWRRGPPPRPARARARR